MMFLKLTLLRRASAIALATLLPALSIAPAYADLRPEPPSGICTNIEPLSQTDGNVQALRRLAQRYGIAAPLLQAKTLERIEFGQELGRIVNELFQKSLKGSVTVVSADITTIEQLQQAFGRELQAAGRYPIEPRFFMAPTVQEVAQLRSLLQKYAPQTSEITLPNNPTRPVFAKALGDFLTQLYKKLAADKKAPRPSNPELAIIQQLESNYSPELAQQPGQDERLEARVATLQTQQFSTTTQLSGEVLFTGKDQLHTRLNGNMANVRVRPGAATSPKLSVPKTVLAPLPAAPPTGVPAPEPGRFSDRDRIHKPGTGNTENYNPIEENPFQRSTTVPLSTFSIDVDTASYSNTRRFITSGQVPPKDAVRIEELINYFPYRYPQPQGDRPFSVTTEVSQAPWNPKHQLVRIGLKGKQLQEVPPSNLVFLIDVSGSMGSPNKLPLVQRSLCLLTRQLTGRDRVTLVVYAGNAGLVLPPTPGDQKQKIMAAIEQLEAGGSTAGGQGIELAYKKAQESFIKGGNNRVILATDGDFNVGASSDAELVRLIEQKRDKGIFLTVLGFGTGNYKDSKMEQLADKGNGNYAYIDTYNEAKKVLGTDLRGTLFTIAKDVKIQVEFNPAKVQAYRLIGYENRALRDQDFNDDRKDAGEIGAGHTVTALYEVIPTGVELDVKVPSIDDLKYQTPKADSTVSNSSELMQVKLRYKQPTDSASQLISQPIMAQSTPIEATSLDMQFATSVAMFGLVLRDSEFKGKASIQDVLTLAKRSQGDDPEGYRQEFVQLVEQYQGIAKTKNP
ncbi:vWA domain-containing protein [Alkalinema pantanalense CENA528]|uniref:vWA domain-containing protein n=1 Tax=Alkalinema pantanalense TaxID=1620705 RepID=UPI003D6FA958